MKMNETEIRCELKEAYTITNLNEGPQKEHGFMYCADDDREVEVRAYWAEFEDGRKRIIHVCPFCANILDGDFDA